MNVKKFKIYKVCIFFVITVIIILLYKYDPSVSDDSLYPGSLFRTLTGFYCPGCGMTRALHEILHGNVKSALALNPLLIIFLPYFIYLFLNICIFSNRIVIHQNLSKKNLWTLVIIFLFYGILRNIPFYPFSLLAPS